MKPMRAVPRLCLVSVLLGGTVFARAEDPPSAAYIGSQVCKECHQAEFERWRGSYHDRAMMEPNDATVLGDFSDVAFTAQGVASRFFRKDDKYLVRTEGPDGQPHDYEIRYTFGWWPLQQYLIDFPGGRLQSLGIAWDSRAAEEGGQRWFLSIRTSGSTPAIDCTGPAATRTGTTSAPGAIPPICAKAMTSRPIPFTPPGPRSTSPARRVMVRASVHLEQARSATADSPPNWGAGKGLLIDLADRDGGVWTHDAKSGLPQRSVPRAKHTQIEMCARCHSRRGQISESEEDGRPFGDTHRLALLDPDLYYPDGQIKDEVYVYGSFLQSRMYQQGVTCTDCHDAHSLKPKAPGNQLCAQCHPAAQYDAESHHHHAPGSAGAACTACHMPQRRYMGVDERADHSLRIPRPDLSLKIGSPNACSTCHADQSVQWAADAARRWYGDATTQRPHFGEALYAGRTGATDAGERLIALAADTSQPGIARATALDLLRAVPDPTYLLTIQRLLKDEDALVRAAAVQSLEVTEPKTLLELGFPLLADPILAVRTEAAHTLAPLARFSLPEDGNKRLDAALREYRAAQLVNAERPESHLNIGLIELAMNDPTAAEQSYRTALRLDPRFGAAYVNLADLDRALGRDAEGEAVLREGLAAAPGDASLYHALGLLRIRRKDLAGAVESLARAAELAPENARYAYVHALAVQKAGDLPKAIAILRTALEQHPGDRDILVALVTMNQESGDQEAAGEYARQLKELWPGAAE